MTAPPDDGPQAPAQGAESAAPPIDPRVMRARFLWATHYAGQSVPPFFGYCQPIDLDVKAVTLCAWEEEAAIFHLEQAARRFGGACISGLIRCRDSVLIWPPSC